MRLSQRRIAVEGSACFSVNQKGTLCRITVDVCVSLRTEGVSVLVDLTGGRLPALVHWGADLGDRSTMTMPRGLTGIAPVAVNLVDEPIRLSLLPEHWTGWVGRPGITGSRGRASLVTEVHHHLSVDQRSGS